MLEVYVEVEIWGRLKFEVWSWSWKGSLKYEVGGLKMKFAGWNWVKPSQSRRWSWSSWMFEVESVEVKVDKVWG